MREIKSNLAKISTLSAHIRAGDDVDDFIIVKKCIVWDKRNLAESFFNYRMPAIRDDQSIVVINFWPEIFIFTRNLGK